MRIVTNKKLARRNRKIATYLAVGTFAALLIALVGINASLFTDSAPDDLILLAQSALLPVAFILTFVSVRMTNLWGRLPRPEKAIEDGLKGLSNKSVLYNYYHFPVRHVLICPQGVFAIVTRWHDQTFKFRGGKFRSQSRLISKIFSAIRFDGVGNPLRDAGFAREHVQRYISEITPEVEVQALVVFVDPSATVEFEDQPDLPVLYADPKKPPNLKNHMRDLKRQIGD